MHKTMNEKGNKKGESQISYFSFISKSAVLKGRHTIIHEMPAESHISMWHKRLVGAVHCKLK